MEYVYLASFFILTYGFVGYMLWTWDKESPCAELNEDNICEIDEIIKRWTWPLI